MNLIFRLCNSNGGRLESSVFKQSFKRLEFCHVYCEYIVESELLYKKGFDSMQGTLFSKEWRDPIRVVQVSMDFFIETTGVAALHGHFFSSYVSF